jgi:hypothetical protein
MEKEKNPWRGLQSYQEGDILYGRNRDIRELTQQVLSSKSTLLYGKSGIGKSSILNAGIIPAARRNGYVPVLVRLSHDEDKNNYFEQIKNAIKRCLLPSESNENAVSEYVKEIYHSKDISNETLYEYFHRHEFYKEEKGQLSRVKLLIIFDQFEEIFTLQHNELFKQSFFVEFADVINDNIPKSLQKEQDLGDVEKIDITSQNGIEHLFDSLDSADDCVLDFVNDNEIHFVFTIREDLLSEFEHYTAFIPSLKRDRYGLRPINEQQAADIILKPQPGLVDVSVAVEIIERVTKHTNIKLDETPQYEVDVAILSLYLSRLYEAKNEEKITATLLKEKGELIIKDFYIEAISCLSEADVVYLEQNLLDANGHRNNISEATLTRQSTISKKMLDSLCNEKKILRTFYYAGAMRVEFIHDILCDVVIQHKLDREQESQQQIQLQMAAAMQAKIKTRSIYIICSVIAFFGLTLFALFKFMSNKQEAMEAESIKHNIIISLLEDSTISATDYWKGNINIVGIYPNGKNITLLHKDVDKGVRDSLYVFDIDSIQSIDFSLQFGDFREIGNYKDIKFSRTKKQLVENPTIKLSVSRNLPKMTPYYGNVCLNIDGMKIPITDAAILMQDRFVRTDSLGNFNLSIDDNLMANQDLSLIIAKEGLACNQYKIHFDDEQIHKYIVEAADSTVFDEFLSRLGTINACRNYSTCGYDSIPGKGVHVNFLDKTKSDRICLRAVKEKLINNRYSLSGYYYFEKEFVKKGVYAYHMFNGFIDATPTKSDNNSIYKKYELVSYDVAMNKQSVTGRYYLNTAVWTGEIRTSWGVYAKF